MFTNTDCCTIYAKTVQNRAPVYAKQVTGPVYWEDTDAQRQGNMEKTPAQSAFICIPATSAYDCELHKGARIVRGLCADETPPSNALTVMSVKDFMYGSAEMQHWEVRAE
jgi:hypothetical protein